jgi:hypothetical protein
VPPRHEAKISKQQVESLRDEIVASVATQVSSMLQQQQSAAAAAAATATPARIGASTEAQVAEPSAVEPNAAAVAAERRTKEALWQAFHSFKSVEQDLQAMVEDTLDEKTLVKAFTDEYARSIDFLREPFVQFASLVAGFLRLETQDMIKKPPSMSDIVDRFLAP